MPVILPIRLTGRTLGERHQNFNDFVKEANTLGCNFDEIKDLPESSPLDRLFKIDVASESKNVQFIIENLKSYDMLYVSRALKSTWLLDSKNIHIINPCYLENSVFIEMTTVAANKMRHWLHAHLRDELRCKEFYNYYKDDNFSLAVKFLPHCPEEYIYDEINSVADKLTTVNFETLVKKYPKVAQIFLSKLETDNKVREIFLSKKDKYFDAIKHLLGSDVELFFDVVEKYNFFYPFKVGMTKKVMKHKNRVMNKIEFYASKLLDVKMMAQSLSVEEVKDVLLRLARAKYLGSWFCYQNVEPLIKRLTPEERTAYRKMLFVEKSFDTVLEWPYDIPSEPKFFEKEANEFIVDPKLDPEDYVYRPCLFSKYYLKKRKVMKRKYGRYPSNNLESLFEKYRFVNFEKTFHELKTKIKIESISRNRLDIILVLISKSAADVKKVKKVLMALTERHCNEPDNMRAAIVRSFVKRCSVWRLPEDSWQLLLEIGQNLGLNGEVSEEICIEGIHATVLRNILYQEQCSPALFKIFCRHFSTFTDYGLNPTEKKIVKEFLPKLLLTAVSDNDNDYACMCIFRLFDTLKDYKIDITKYPGAVSTIVEYCSRDEESAELILKTLYSLKISRKELIEKYFEINQNENSFLNALRHGPSLLQNGTKLKQFLSDSDNKCPKRFLRSLILYFGETDGLADRHFSSLKENIGNQRPFTASRSLAILSRTHLMKMVEEVKSNVHLPDEERNKLIKELFDNMHLAKVFINFKEDWKAFGAVAIANLVLICKEKDVSDYLLFLKTWRKTAKLALFLAKRCGCSAAVIKEMAVLWPHFIIKMGFMHLKENGDAINLDIWETTKALLCKMDVDKTRRTVENNVVKLKKIASQIIEEYCVLVLKMNLQNVSCRWHKFILCHLNNCIPCTRDDFTMDYLCGCIIRTWSEDSIDPDSEYFRDDMRLYIDTVAKLLVMCDIETQQNTRLDSIGKIFFDHVKKLWNNEKYSELALEIVDEFLSALVHIEVFSNSKYVSPVNCFLRIQDNMNDIFSEEIIFTRLLNLNLTILCYNSIRNCLTTDPTLQTDNRIMAVTFEKIGVEFGKNIAQECDRLIARYFKSVVEIFQTVIHLYLKTNFRIKGRNVDLVCPIAKCILESGCTDDSKVLAVRIFKNGSYSSNSDTVKMLREEIKNTCNLEMQYLNNAVIYA